MTPSHRPAERSERTTKALLATAERRVLVWIAARLPGWVLPDQLSLLALLGAVVIAAADVARNCRKKPVWILGAGE